MPQSRNPVTEFLHKVGLVVLVPITSWSFILSGDVSVLKTKDQMREKVQENIDKKLDIIITKIEELRIEQEKIKVKVEQKK